MRHHPERQRRISVRAAFVWYADKYQSAGQWIYDFRPILRRLTAAGAVKKWLSLYQIVRQSGGRRLIVILQGKNWHKHSPRFIVISTVAERSGEISLQNETSHTVTGDLSTQSLNIAKYLCPHIDMQLRSRWQFGEQLTVILRIFLNL